MKALTMVVLAAIAFTGISGTAFAAVPLPDPGRPLILAAGSVGYDPVNVKDLAPDILGYDETIFQNTYSEYVTYLGSIKVRNAKKYFTDEICGYGTTGYTCFTPKDPGSPQDFLLVKYTDTGGKKSVTVEIYDFGTRTLAQDVYKDQTFGDNQGGIFNRVVGEGVLLHRDRFLVFLNEGSADAAGKSTLTDLTQNFVDNLFTVVPTEQPSPPSVTSKVVWGVRPGDIISWEWNRAYNQGTVSFKRTMEIVKTAGDNSAILIKKSENSPPDFDYAVSGAPYTNSAIGSNIPLTAPAYSYFWATDTVGDPDAPCALLYPVSVKGQTLEDKIGSMGYDITESDEYLTATFATPSEFAGVQTTETQRRQFTIHRGTGITTSASSDYYNKENSVGSSSELKLSGTNFDLRSRVPMIPATPSPTQMVNPSAPPTTSSPPSRTPSPSIPVLIIVIGFAAYLRLKKEE
jgi:hypothetical protein